MTSAQLLSMCVVEDVEQNLPNAGFRLTCRLPHCRFDDDISWTGQASLAAEGWPSGKQRHANRSITLPLCPPRQITDSWILFNSGAIAARWKAKAALLLRAATLKQQAMITRRSGKAASGKLVWNQHNTAMATARRKTCEDMLQVLPLEWATTQCSSCRVPQCTLTVTSTYSSHSSTTLIVWDLGSLSQECRCVLHIRKSVIRNRLLSRHRHQSSDWWKGTFERNISIQVAIKTGFSESLKSLNLWL